MNLNISYRHTDSSPAVNERIEEKINHLSKFFEDQIKVDWVCSVQKERHRSEANVHAGHWHFHAEDESDSLYKTIDNVISKLERQLGDKDAQVKDKLHRRHKED